MKPRGVTVEAIKNNHQSDEDRGLRTIIADNYSSGADHALRSKKWFWDGAHPKDVFNYLGVHPEEHDPIDPQKVARLIDYIDKFNEKNAIFSDHVLIKMLESGRKSRSMALCTSLLDVTSIKYRARIWLERIALERPLTAAITEKVKKNPEERPDRVYDRMSIAAK